MNNEFSVKSNLLLPGGLDLSGSMWVQCGVDIFEGGKFEQDPKLGLINVGGKCVGTHTGPAKSFMRSWAIGLIRSLFYAPSNTPEQYTDDGGVARFHAYFEGLSGSNQGVTAAPSDFAFGDSNTAINATHFNLQGAILGPATPSGPVVTTVTQENSVARIFKVEGTVLNTGASFDVKEVGLFAHLRQGDLGGQNRRSMLMRDIVSPMVTVANGQTALGRYTFTAAI
jgi:hypothetical protein